MKANKVLVALSGGVDSAVSAAILKQRGLEVVGVFFDFGPWGAKSFVKAKKISKALDIPLKIIDARKDFQKNIIDYFVASYKKGITPNPCVVCNKEMKFALLFRLLREYKADHIATGHYVRKGKFGLHEALDKTKDQSYFLYTLDQKELARSIFPLGGLRKTETKRLAKKFKLPVTGDEESQDVCFLLDKDINAFLGKRIKPKPGSIVDEKGNIIGRHKGLPFYTIGQRKGIEIGGSGPYFVIGKNAKKNELNVSSDPKKLLAKKFFVKDVNWIRRGQKLPMRATVQIRYHSEKFPAIIRPEKSGKIMIEANKPLRAVTPGQSAVFYRKEVVLGGGIIV